jgi:hypothetical protein
MANLSNINNKFLVTTGGNVLIGKTAVTGTSKLQVSGSLLIGTDISSGIPLVVQETTADGFAIGFMRNTNATNGNGLVIDVNSTAGAYIQDWRQASTVKMRLLQNGNLGIGTDSPDFALDIEAVSSGVQLQIGRTNTSAGSTWMGSDSNGFHLGVGTYGAGNSVTDPNGFTVLTSGNVGIGTVSPTSKLDISDAVDRVMNSNGEGQFEITGNGYTFGIAMGNTTTALYHNSDVRSLTLGTNETPRLTILGGGNVGIGVTSPGAKLDVDGSIRLSTSGTVEGRSYPYTTNIGSGADATTTYLIAGSTASLVTSIDLAGASAANPKTIIFKTASTERMRITSGGDLNLKEGGNFYSGQLRNDGVNVPATSTTVLDFTGETAGIYIITVCREGVSTGENLVCIASWSGSSGNVLTTLTNAGFISPVFVGTSFRVSNGNNRNCHATAQPLSLA